MAINPRENFDAGHATHAARMAVARQGSASSQTHVERAASVARRAMPPHEPGAPSPSRELPRNMDGSLKCHDIVHVMPDAQGQASAAFWWKTAAIGSLGLFGAAAIAGFVTASICAPGALPFVVIGIALLTFSEVFGAPRLYRYLMEQSSRAQEIHRKDVFIETKLEEWRRSDLLIEEVLNNYENGRFTDFILKGHPLHDGHVEELERLKPLFAWFMFVQQQDNDIDEKYGKLQSSLTEKHEAIAKINTRIEEEFRKGNVNPQALIEQRAKLMGDFKALEAEENAVVAKWAYYRCAGALILSILRNPLNALPESSPLDWRGGLLPPVHFDEHVPGRIPHDEKPYSRLANGEQITIRSILDNPVEALAVRIQVGIDQHIAYRNAQDAAAAAAAAAPA